MKFKHPHVYGLMAIVDKKDYRFLSKYKKQLNPYVEFYMKKEVFDNIAPQHISLCYFSYPKKYPQKYVKQLIPAINKVAKKYLPLKIKVQGLKGAWELGWNFPAILWNIKNFKEINKFHKELIKILKCKIKHFNDKDLDFTPHIGIALGKKEKIPELKRIVSKSKKDKIIELNISSLQIFFPKGPEEIYRRRK
jgi:2'-5' RNA ligase